VNRIFLILSVLLLAAALVGCMQPMDSDFKGEQKGLDDDELVWILHVDRESMGSDSLTYRTYNEPIFDQVIPAILSELQASTLPAYDNYETLGEEKPLDNLEDRLQELNATWQDVSAFVQGCEIYARGRTKSGEFSSRAEYLRLIWQDPDQLLPSRSFVNVRMDDLKAKNFRIKVRGENLDLIAYLNSGRPASYPVYLRSNTVEYRTRSRDEAEYLRDMVLEGRWPEVKWVENGINISGKEAIALTEKEVRPYTGDFWFTLPPKDSLSDSTRLQLFLTGGPGFLVADWSDRLNVEKVDPWAKGRFFTYEGEFYDFLNENNELRVVKGRDTLSGVRLEPES
jgi:hypothetical protein